MRDSAYQSAFPIAKVWGGLKAGACLIREGPDILENLIPREI